MKVLHLMRHGKSSWEGTVIHDIDRPLLERGIINCQVMAEKFLGLFEKPELIISSSANRAMHSASIFARAINFPIDKICFTDRLYDANVNEIMNIVTNIDNKIQSALLVGHNPGFTDIANIFFKPGIDNLGTSGIASIVCHTDKWSDIQSCKGKTNLLSPKKP